MNQKKFNLPVPLSSYKDDAFQIRTSFLEASTKLKSISGVTFNVANKVYLPEGAYDLQEEIKNDAIKVFDAGIEKLDFSNGAAAADTINKWVFNYLLPTELYQGQSHD